MSILDKIDKELDRLDEAEETTWDELPKETQGVLKMMGVKPDRVQPFSGIHGEVVSFKGSMPFRIHKKDFNKLKNKKVRWLDIKSIGL